MFSFDVQSSMFDSAFRVFNYPCSIIDFVYFLILWCFTLDLQFILFVFGLWFVFSSFEFWFLIFTVSSVWLSMFSTVSDFQFLICGFWIAILFKFWFSRYDFEVWLMISLSFLTFFISDLEFPCDFSFSIPPDNFVLCNIGVSIFEFWLLVFKFWDFWARWEEYSLSLTRLMWTMFGMYAWRILFALSMLCLCMFRVSRCHQLVVHPYFSFVSCPLSFDHQCLFWSGIGDCFSNVCLCLLCVFVAIVLCECAQTRHLRNMTPSTQPFQMETNITYNGQMAVLTLIKGKIASALANQGEKRRHSQIKGK